MAQCGHAPVKGQETLECFTSPSLSSFFSRHQPPPPFLLCFTILCCGSRGVAGGEPTGGSLCGGAAWLGGLPDLRGRWPAWSWRPARPVPGRWSRRPWCGPWARVAGVLRGPAATVFVPAGQPSWRGTARLHARLCGHGGSIRHVGPADLGGRRRHGRRTVAVGCTSVRRWLRAGGARGIQRFLPRTRCLQDDSGKI